MNCSSILLERLLVFYIGVLWLYLLIPSAMPSHSHQNIINLERRRLSHLLSKQRLTHHRIMDSGSNEPTRPKWSRITKPDSDGNTIVTFEKGRVDGADLLRDFREHNKEMKSNGYVQSINRDFDMKGKKPNKKRNGAKRFMKRLAKRNRPILPKGRGVFSPQAKPYIPVGNMNTVGKHFLLVRELEKEQGVEQMDPMLREKLKRRSGKRSPNRRSNKAPHTIEELVAGEAPDNIKSRSARLTISTFPKRVVSESDTVVGKVQRGQFFDAGIHTLNGHLLHFRPFLHLEPRPPSTTRSTQSGNSPTKAARQVKNLEDMVYEIKSKTNGEIDIQINKEDAKRIHMYTANAGPHAKTAALHTERMRLLELKRTQDATREDDSDGVYKEIMRRRRRRSENPEVHAQETRRKAQRKVETWMDSFVSVSTGKEESLASTLAERDLDHMEIAEHVIKDFDGWGFGGYPPADSLDNHNSPVRTRHSPDGKGWRNVWSARRDEIYGKLEEHFFAQEARSMYRDFVFFACDLEGKPKEDDLALMELVKKQIEQGGQFDKSLLNVVYDEFGKMVATNIRVARLIEWILLKLEKSKKTLKSNNYG